MDPSGTGAREPHPLGLESGTVRVVPYDPRWPDLFAQARAELEEVLGPEVVGVHHVGSTSVAGLAAKPILDMLAGVAHFEQAVALVPGLEALGYEYRPGEETPDRHYFRRPGGPGRVRTHHLSLAEPGSHHFRVTIAFRDALRGDPELAREYRDLKLRLAREHPRDREAYLAGKAPFIERVLARSGADLGVVSSRARSTRFRRS